MIDDLMVSVHVGPGVTEASVDHVNVYTVRSCLVLRVLLLETRQQLNLLASNFAAARLDVADNIQLLQRFPTLLVSLQPSVHLQAGLYSQAVGAYDAAVSHLSKAAQTPDDHMRVCARCLAALSYLAQGAPDAGGTDWRLHCSIICISRGAVLKCFNNARVNMPVLVHCLLSYDEAAASAFWGEFTAGNNRLTACFCFWCN